MSLNPRILSSESVPERLRGRLVELVGRPMPALRPPEALLAVAVDTTRELLRGEQADRRTALDVLAVDALVTHAVELMAAEPGEFEDRCGRALTLLSSPDLT